jgi:hypothetical protein
MLAGMKMNAQPNAVGRRSVLAAGAVGVGAAGLLAACGDDSDSSTSSSSSESPAAAPSTSASADSSGSAADALASTSSVNTSAITCSCHQSRFSLTDGSVLGGPATSPLPSEEITVSGTSITLS